jgi:hypothetical protein
VLQKIEQSLAEAISLNVKYIQLALEGDAFLNLSTLGMGPSTESSPCQYVPPADNPYLHHRKGKDSHQHIRDIQEKSLSDYAQQDWPVVTK